MFNRNNKEAAEPRFTPDHTGSFVAALDCQVADRLRYGHSKALLHRLIGREQQDDGSERLVVLTTDGPRNIDPDEPHLVMTHAEEKGFDFVAWRSDERGALRDRERAARLNAQKNAARERLRWQLVMNTGPATMEFNGAQVSVNNEAQRIASELIAEGLGRSLGDGYVVTTEAQNVDLSRWPYLNRQGTGTFTPVTRSGLRLLVHGTPGKDGLAVASGRYPVVGTVTAHVDGTEWTAYGVGVQLVGPGVAGTWDTRAGLDVREWVNERKEEDERRRDAEAAEAARPWLRDALLTRYAYRPRNDIERAVCADLAREGLCYEVEGSYVLVRPV